MIWYARYWIGRWLLTLGLWILPRGRYHAELTQMLYDLKHKVILEVLVRRAFKEQVVSDKRVDEVRGKGMREVQ